MLSGSIVVAGARGTDGSWRGVRGGRACHPTTPPQRTQAESVRGALPVLPATDPPVPCGADRPVITKATWSPPGARTSSTAVRAHPSASSLANPGLSNGSEATLTLLVRVPDCDGKSPDRLARPGHHPEISRPERCPRYPAGLAKPHSGRRHTTIPLRRVFRCPDLNYPVRRRGVRVLRRSTCWPGLSRTSIGVFPRSIHRREPGHLLAKVST